MPSIGTGCVKSTGWGRLSALQTFPLDVSVSQGRNTTLERRGGQSSKTVEVCREGFWPLCDAEVQQPADESRSVCDVGGRKRLGSGTRWPAEQIREWFLLSCSVLHVEALSLQLERP